MRLRSAANDKAREGGNRRGREMTIYDKIAPHSYDMLGMDNLERRRYWQYLMKRYPPGYHWDYAWWWLLPIDKAWPTFSEN